MPTTGGRKTEKIYEQIPREIFRDFRRPQHFRRLDDDTDQTTSTNSKAIMLKDLVIVVAVVVVVVVVVFVIVFRQMYAIMLKYLSFISVVEVVDFDIGVFIILDKWR